MLVTLLTPTAGTARVAGYDVATQPVQVRRSIGYCSQVGSTFSGAYAGDEVVDHGMLYGMSRKDAVAKGQELFEKFQLDGLWKRMNKNMSGGQKRRLDIVMGLIHSPVAGLPRRADHRARPAGAREPLGAHRGAAHAARARRSS